MADGAEWYEVRTKLSCISYEITEHEAILKDARALVGIFGAAMYYCWIESKKINNCQVG